MIHKKNANDLQGEPKVGTLITSESGVGNINQACVLPSHSFFLPIECVLVIQCESLRVK